MGSALDQVLQRLRGATGPDRNGWQTAYCPFHDDQHRPNLRFRSTGFKCMSCGEKGNIRKLAAKLGVVSATEKHIKPRIVDTYDYCDEAWTLLSQVVRYLPKGFKQRRPDGKGGWAWTMDGVRRVLYHLPELLAAPQDRWIFVAEGEKAVNALVEKGLTATCSPMGAGKWRQEYVPPFSGRKVVILPDNDEPGIRHACQVAVTLANIAQTLRVVSLPGLGHGEDVYDWLERGNTADDLWRLVEDAPPWKAPGGLEVLDAIVTFIRRFVVVSQQEAHTIALWVVHTHALDVAEATPYLHITSVEKRCGKTRLLEILELLVRQPWFTGRVTAAVLARKVDAECPTLLLDESDAAFNGDKEYSETLRSMLNTGYRRGGKASVCVGQGARIGYKDLSTFCPKGIAGIGKLPDTVADRSIPIALKRRLASEPVERYRRRPVESEASQLRDRVVAWLSASTGIAGTVADIPSALDDRAADCWEPLLAIADAAGGDWPRRARCAATGLMACEARQDDSLGVRLLADVQKVFEDSLDQLSSADLIRKLVQIEEAPWSDLGGKPLDPRRLASLLKGYGIRPQTIRVADKTPKGYRKEDFSDAWSRYLAPGGGLSATPQHPASGQIQNQIDLDPQQVGPLQGDVADNSHSCARHNVADVADKRGEMEDIPQYCADNADSQKCEVHPVGQSNSYDAEDRCDLPWEVDV